MSKNYLICAVIVFSFFIANQLFSQITNDDCVNATPLNDIVGWCSDGGAYTTTGATTSSGLNTTCWGTINNDVWFSLVAVATDVSIVVQSNGVWGTLDAPEVALYDNCSASLALICGTSTAPANIVQVLASNLTVGQTYYIRIDGGTTSTGTFKLCVDNYNAPIGTASDCVDAITLCSKDAFTVPSIVGVGNDGGELVATCLNSEFASAWYQWTCETSGTLTFTLTPTNSTDDLDFLVYELPNGLGNCLGKDALRCMASGQNVGQPQSNWIACTGATGLDDTNTDLQENPGCQSGDDNFLAALNMVAGKSYALVVNNFSNTGNGFSITFGGTGTFVSPVANFTKTADTLCVGEPITFQDSSYFNAGNIVGWDWNHGENATPLVTTLEGPNMVTYNRPGTKYVRLRIETDAGCTLNEIKEIVVEPCCETVNSPQITSVSVDVVCARNDDGMILIDATNIPYIPHTYTWGDINDNVSDRTGLKGGAYSVTFTDAIGCDTILNFDISEPPFFQADTILQQPTCAGGQDGGLTLLMNGGVAPYQYTWTPVSSSSNVLTNISNGFYDVTVTDAGGCDTTMTFKVWELELLLDTIQDFAIPPSCYGGADGSITVTVANGKAPYSFNWNGQGNTTSNTVSNLSAGTYTLTVTDDNLCQGSFVLEMSQPDSLDIWLEGYDVSCFDGSDGEITAQVTGGVGNYSYSWSTASGAADSLNQDLPAGWYAVSVTDGNGCFIWDSTTLEQPPEIFVDSIGVQNAFCFGTNEGQINVVIGGGTAPFEYSLDGMNYQATPFFDSLYYGYYTVWVKDNLGCVTSTPAFVNQPWEFMLELNDDVTIDLGYSTQLQSSVNTLDSVTYTWTPTEALSCADCKNPIANPLSTTTYTLTVVNETGCIAIDSVTVFVNLKKPVFVPNVFTPNGDGINDAFFVQGNLAIRTVRNLKIFDRWGERIYEAQNLGINDPALGWDGTHRGKLVMPAVFVYYVEVEFLDGEVQVLTGDVTVVR